MQSAARKNPEAFRMTGDWSAQSERLKATFPKLTDTDLQYVFNRDHDMLKRIETRLKKKRDEVMRIIKKVQAEKSLLPGPT
jgi:hypothetical protein